MYIYNLLILFSLQVLKFILLPPFPRTCKTLPFFLGYVNSFIEFCTILVSLFWSSFSVLPYWLASQIFFMCLLFPFYSRYLNHITFLFSCNFPSDLILFPSLHPHFFIYSSHLPGFLSYFISAPPLSFSPIF